VAHYYAHRSTRIRTVIMWWIDGISRNHSTVLRDSRKLEDVASSWFGPQSVRLTQSSFPA